MRHLLLRSIACVVVAAGPAAGQVDPFEVVTDGWLTADFDGLFFSIESTAVYSIPDLGIDQETAWGTMIITDDAIFNEGEITFSGPGLSASGPFTGMIPINPDGTFGLGTGTLLIDEATGSLAHWIGISIPFTSDCGTFDDPDNPNVSEYHNVYTYVPSAGSVACFCMAALLTTWQRRRR